MFDAANSKVAVWVPVARAKRLCCWSMRLTPGEYQQALAHAVFKQGQGLVYRWYPAVSANQLRIDVQPGACGRPVRLGCDGYRKAGKKGPIADFIGNGR